MVMLEKMWMDLRVYIEEMESGSKIWKVECCWNSMIRRAYVWQTWFKKKRKVTYNLDGTKTGIDFVLVEIESRKLRCQGDFLGTATQVSSC